MLRVVFDAVIFVRSLLNPTSRWATLVFDRAPDYQLVVSQPVVDEVKGVLDRTELARRFSTLAGRDAVTVLAKLATAEYVSLDPETIPSVSRDRKDDKYPATAVGGRTDYLVSEDLDLLVLGAYQGIPIIDARTFLSLLSRETS